MDVCIPLVFRVRAFKLWCVKLEVLGGSIGGGWWLELVVAGISVMVEGRGFRVFLVVGSGGWWLVWVFRGLGVVIEVVWSRACAYGEGFRALHWNMLSWLGVCIMVLRGFLFGWAGGLWLGVLCRG